MKISCLPVSYFSQIISGKTTIFSWLREAAALGLDGADLSILFFENRDRTRLTKIKDTYQSLGLKLPLLNIYPQLLHPDTTIRKDEITQLKKDIEVAGLLGAEYVRIVSGQWFPDVSKKEGLQRTFTGLDSAAETAAKHGIGLVYENHSQPSSWEFSDFSYNPDIFMEISDRVKNTPIKLLFDTANPVAYGVDPLPLLEKIYVQVACIHVADTSEYGTFCPTVIGDGVVPLKEIFAFLKEKNYSGWLSIEEASATGKSGVETACRYVMENT